MTLSLSPALAPSLGAAPAAAAAPLPVPLAAPLAVPAPLPASPAALPGNIPAAAASPAAKSAAAAAPLEKRLEDTAISDDGADRTREALLDRLFGEDAGSGEALPPYLRPDQPLAFGARETAEYRAARAPAQKAAAAVPLLESAGVKVGAKDGKVLVLPVKDGTPLNRLAWNLMRAHGAKVVYDPVRLGDSGVAVGIAAMSAEIPMMFSGFFKSCTMELAKRPTSANRSESSTSRLNWRKRRMISLASAPASRGVRSSNISMSGREMKYTVVGSSAVAVAERG